MCSMQPRSPLSAVVSGGLILVLLATAPASAQVVQGTVIENESRAPIPGVEVILQREMGEEQIPGQAQGQVVTDSLGAFYLPVPAPGSYSLLLRRIGYATRTTAAFMVAADEVVITEIRLSTEALHLEPLEVVERRRERDPQLRAFHERAEVSRRSGRGRIYYQEDLKRVGSVRSLYSLQPKRRGCPMEVLVDNLPVGDIRDLDFLAAIDRVEGVEIYWSPQQIPPELSRFRSCALMLVWTKRPSGRPFSLKRTLIGAALAATLFLIAR